MNDEEYNFNILHTAHKHIKDERYNVEHHIELLGMHHCKQKNNFIKNFFYYYYFYFSNDINLYMIRIFWKISIKKR